MPRIPEDELARLKAEVDLAALVRAAGVELKIHGADLVGRCPFHDDKGPSLVVTPEKNLWHCMGACQKGGSVIDWVMTAQGVSFRHAVEILRDKNPSLAAGPPIGAGGAVLGAAGGLGEPMMPSGSRRASLYLTTSMASPFSEPHTCNLAPGSSAGSDANTSFFSSPAALRSMKRVSVVPSS